MPAISRLEAVNEMLLAIGQAPVNSLIVAGIRDVSVADQILTNVTRELQTAGHSFNTFDITLQPDVNGKITVPADVLHIDNSKRIADGADPLFDPVVVFDQAVNADVLFDKYKNTQVFEKSVLVEVIRDVPFDKLPQHARRYFLAMAKLRFQASVVGSDALNRLIEQELYAARADFRKTELLQQDNNIFDGGATMISRGRHRLHRYR